MKPGKNWSAAWPLLFFSLAAAMSVHLTASGQILPNDAISREISLFNFGLPPNSTEAISREVSIFNFGPSSAAVEAISREVSVLNYGVSPVLFFVGSTNALKDEPNQVPFVLQTVLDLTNISLALKTDDSRLRILGVTPFSPEVVSAGVGAENSNAYPITFTLNPGALPPTNRILAYLNFQGITNLDSAIVPLTITSFIATRAGGQIVPDITSDGRVIFIVTRPLLFVTNNPQFSITMYGVPGTTNAVEVTTNLSSTTWLELERLFVNDRVMTLPGVTTNVPRLFFRTRQVWP